MQTKEIGRKRRRRVLTRSKQMEEAILDETDILVADFNSGMHIYDGLIYIMYRKQGSKSVPLYIGKAETISKTNNLPANIKNLHRNKSKFARWGDNYAYHIGDLSAAVLPGHPKEKVKDKYRVWANALFRHVPSDQPELKFPILFWCKAWSTRDTGIWKEFGPTRLAFLEYLLISVASSLVPQELLNA